MFAKKCFIGLLISRLKVRFLHGPSKQQISRLQNFLLFAIAEWLMPAFDKAASPEKAGRFCSTKHAPVKDEKSLWLKISGSVQQGLYSSHSHKTLDMKKLIKR